MSGLPGVSLIESSVELSVVMPCLNEADTLENRIRKAPGVFDELSIRGEIIIADDGGNDGSQEIAEKMGERVIHLSEKGLWQRVAEWKSLSLSTYYLLSKRAGVEATMTSNVEFDDYAEDYAASMTQALSVSGEDIKFFARGRIAWLSHCLAKRDERPCTVMDFGCGIGSALPYLFDILGAKLVIGVDVSPKTLDRARQNLGGYRGEFMLINDYHPGEQIDLVFCNGVFHHIPVDQRAALITYIYQSLRPGGLFALWENNPWNPGTRYVMSQCLFDEDAITLTPPEARRLTRAGGFEVLRTDFLFIFPHFLRWFRPLETLVTQFPFGAQYQILCRKD